jgi:hypothetical protein
VLLEKLIGFQAVKKYSEFYGTEKLIGVFTTARSLVPLLTLLSYF